MTFLSSASLKILIATIFFASHAYGAADMCPDKVDVKKTKAAELCEKALVAAGQKEENIRKATLVLEAIAPEDTSKHEHATAAQITASALETKQRAASAECAAAHKECDTPCKASKAKESKDKCAFYGDASTKMQMAADGNRDAAKGFGDVADATGANDTDGAGDKGGDKDGGGGGGMNPMMAGLAGAAIGGIAGYMISEHMKKKKEEEAKKKAGDDDDAITDAGQLDCSHKTAYKYSDCDANLLASCGANPDAPNCSCFVDRYCSASTTSSCPLGTGAVADDMPAWATAGGGIAQPFCKKANSAKYCKTAGRESCPSCVNLQKQNSQACSADPALCLAQNSSEQIEKAKLTCPTDPMFADPAYAGGGGGQVPTDTIQNGGGDAPIAVLPQSASGESDFDTAMAQSQARALEQVTGGTQSSDLDQAKQAVSGYAQTSAGVGGVRNVASAKNHAGPNSEIGGQYGPGLFSTTTQFFKNRCLTFKINNCPQP